MNNLSGASNYNYDNYDSYDNYSKDLNRSEVASPPSRPSRAVQTSPQTSETTTPDRPNTIRQRDSIREEGNILRIDETELNNVITEANRSLRFSGTPRAFSYIRDEVTNMVTIRITDAKTDELIKEIPPEEHVAAIRKMWELNGLIVDEQL